MRIRHTIGNLHARFQQRTRPPTVTPSNYSTALGPRGTSLASRPSTPPPVVAPPVASPPAASSRTVSTPPVAPTAATWADVAAARASAPPAAPTLPRTIAPPATVVAPALSSPQPVAYAVFNLIELGRLQDRLVGALDDCVDLQSVNATLQHAQTELQTVHPRLAARKADVTAHIAEAALARAAADVQVGSDEAHIDTFVAQVAEMGAPDAPYDLLANLRMMSLLNRSSYSFDECALSLENIARDMGGKPTTDAEKKARQALIENVQTWVLVAPSKLPPAVPYLLAAFNRAIAALAQRTGVTLDIELLMPTDDANLAVAEDLYEAERAAATARDAELAQQMARGMNLGAGRAYDSDSD